MSALPARVGVGFQRMNFIMEPPNAIGADEKSKCPFPNAIGADEKARNHCPQPPLMFAKCFFISVTSLPKVLSNKITTP
jgi:hypothetical protein